MTKLLAKFKMEPISAYLIFLAVFFLTRQFPFKGFSDLILVFTMLAFLAAIKGLYLKFHNSSKSIKVIGIVYFIAFTVMLLYSIFLKNNNMVYAVRTYMTCILLIVAYFFPKDSKIVKGFLYALLIHALILIGIEIVMLICSSTLFNNMVRGYIKYNGFGDIYTRNSIYFRIIAKGNELLPVAFMISYYYNIGMEKYFKYIFLIAVIISGNLAFFIAIAVFLFINIVASKKYIKLLAGLSLLGAIVAIIFNNIIIKYVKNVIEIKNKSSLPIRYEQIRAFISEIKTTFDMIFGTGMGNTIDFVGHFRDYRGKIYFELQTIYFFVQLGVILFAFFLFINILLTYKYMKNKKNILIYLCYILYASTNPYMLNLSHILIIITLVSYDKYINEPEQAFNNITS